MTVADLKKVLEKCRDTDEVRILFEELGRVFSVKAQYAESEDDALKVRIYLGEL